MELGLSLNTSYRGDLLVTAFVPCLFGFLGASVGYCVIEDAGLDQTLVLVQQGGSYVLKHDASCSVCSSWYFASSLWEVLLQ